MLAAEIAQHLHAYSLGVYNADTPITFNDGDYVIYVDFMRDEPDEAICIRQTGAGRRDMRLTMYDYPQVEVLVRGDTDSRNAEAQAQAVYDCLHGITEGTLDNGTTRIIKCQAANGPNSLGPDGNGRFNYSINFDLIIRRI